MNRLLFLIASVLLVFNAFSQEVGFVRIEEGVLHYKVYGKGRPLLFLNGGPGYSSIGYEGIAKMLKEGRKVILFDPRGTGKSKIDTLTDQTVTIVKMTRDIERLRKHLKIKKWDVMGQSYGGVYAQFYVAFYPERIRKLLLVSTLSSRNNRFSDAQHFETTPPELFTDREKELYTELKEQNLSPEQKNKLVLGLKARHYVYHRSNIPEAIKWFIETAGNLDSELFELVVNSSGPYDLRPLLKEYMKPVLILHGSHDFIHLNAPYDLDRMFPDSQLNIIQNCGHMIWLDQPAILKQKIEEFLR